MATMLQDKDAIRELLAEYCFQLDAGNYAEMAALFTDDGTWDTAFGKGTGHEGIVAQATRIAQQSTARPRRVHLVTNIVIRLDGERAQVASNWVVVENNAEGPRIGSAGGYADDLVKRDGFWFFHIRKIDRFIAPGQT
jgi:uncharacterized protein (TIGR02246 family)